MALVHYCGLKFGHAAEVLGLDEDLAVRLHEEVMLETHGAMLRAAT
jgi:hypothetical protein